MALRQFALDLGAQVLDFFLVDEQVAVAGDAKLVATEHLHAGKQFMHELVQDRRQEDEGILAGAQFARQADDPRQDARRLHDRRTRAAPEGIPPFEFDGEVETLVEHPREGVRGVEADRRDHRHHFAKEEVPDPFALFDVPVCPLEETNAFGSKLWQDFLVEQCILLPDDGMDLLAHQLVDLACRLAVSGDRDRVQFQLFLDARLADLEELVKIAAHDAEEAQPLEQGGSRALGLPQDSPVERQQTHLAILEILRREGRGCLKGRCFAGRGNYVHRSVPSRERGRTGVQLQSDILQR